MTQSIKSISNEAVEAANKLEAELPEFSGDHITKHRELVLAIIQSAITKACAERDEKADIRRKVTVLDACNEMLRGLTATIGVIEKQRDAKSTVGGEWNDGYSAAMDDAIQSIRSLIDEIEDAPIPPLSAQLAVMKEALEKAPLPNCGVSDLARWTTEIKVPALSNLPAAAEEPLRKYLVELRNTLAGGGTLFPPRNVQQFIAAAEELLKDREDLDWLEKGVAERGFEVGYDRMSAWITFPNGKVFKADTLRFAIAEARKT